MSGGYRVENPYLLAAATHAVVIRGVDVSLGPHPGAVNFASIDRAPIHNALEVIQIVGGGPTGYAELLAVPTGWASGWRHALPPVQGELVPAEYPAHFSEVGWRKPAAVRIDAELVKSLPLAFNALRAAKPNVRIAARRARRCFMRSDQEDVLVDAAIGLEALLGNARDELTHRLAQRAAAALADKFDPAEVYSTVKKVYSARSKVVHGAELKSTRVHVGGEGYSAPYLARFVLEELLRDLLLGADWTPESLDARIIAQLSNREPDRN